MNSLVKHNSFLPLDLERFFSDSFVHDFFKDSLPSLSDSLPANVYETDKNWVMELAAAGYDKEDINVSSEDHVLSIHIDKASNEEEKDRNYTIRKLAGRSYQQSLSFSQDYDVASTEVIFKDGLLKIAVPKTKRKDSKKLIIKTE